jgi:hypothetical protein
MTPKTSATPSGIDADAVTRFLLAKAAQGASASEVAQLVATSCFEIDKALTPIIGERGLTALLKRSLHTASVQQAWLSSCQETLDLKTDLPELMAAFSQQTPKVAALGGGLFLEQFHQLLTALVGPSLTERLLRSVWANFLSGSFAQDSPQDSPP